MEKEQLQEKSVNEFKSAFNHLSQFLVYLLKSWRIILLAGIIGLGLGVLYAWLRSPKYKAELSFVVEEENAFRGGLLSIASSFGLNVGDLSGAFVGDNIIEFIKSSSIVEKALLRPTASIVPNYSLLNFYFDSVLKEKKIPSSIFRSNSNRETFSRYEDSLLKTAIKNIKEGMLEVDRPNKKLNIIKVTCISSKEKFSKEFSENLIEEATSFYVKSKTTRNTKIVSLLQTKADSIYRVISGNMVSRAITTDANINLAIQLPSVAVQKNQMNISMLSAAYGEILKNLEIAKFNLQRETPFIQKFETPSYPLEKISRGRLFTGIIFALILEMLTFFFLYIWFAFGQVNTKRD